MLKKNGFKPIDLISYAYVFFNMVYIAIGWNRVSNAGLHFGALALIAVLVYILIRLYHEESGWFLSFLRLWYPFILFTYFFTLTTIVNRVIFTEYIDPFIIYIDYLIFGYQPALVWGQLSDNIVISEILYFAYFSYYLVVPGIAFLLYFKRREIFEKYAFTISFVFYVCYFTYTFLPVIGGRFLPGVPELTTAMEGGPFQHIMAFIYRTSDHWGSAFPSSHVAISVTANIAAIQYLRRIGYWLIPLNILLVISTVYCHYHYFIDTIFGLFYGVIFYFVALRLYHYLKGLLLRGRDSQKVTVKEDLQLGENETS